MMSRCTRMHKQIRYVFSGGKLAADALQRLETHLAECARCQEIYAQEQALTTLFRRSFAPYHAQKEAILVRLRASVQAATQEPIVPSVSWWSMYRKVWGPALVVVGMLLLVLLPVYFKQVSQLVLVKAVRGTGIFYLSPGSIQWLPVQEGTKFPLGSQLTTNRWSQAELHLGGSTRIWINENTYVHLSQDKSGGLFLQQGELFIQQPHLKIQAFRQVRTPAGVVIPVGTSYDISVLDTGITRVAVVLGRVRLSNAVGAVVIPAGYQAEAEVTQQKAPSLPVAIDTSAVCRWVETFREVTRYPRQTREQLAYEAIRLGNQYYQEQDYYAALTSYQRSVAWEPELASGYYGIGRSYYRLNRYGQAMSAYSQALRLDPTLNDARYQLILCLIKLERFTEARRQAEWLVHQVPTDHGYAIILAEVYRHLGYLEIAEQWYRYGLTLSPCAECIQIAHTGLAEIARKRK
ncbi:MAG: tetratricopeptide repeat protein [bacterium]|nr:tetratricopeptide repeat protein [bacterium]